MELLGYDLWNALILVYWSFFLIYFLIWKANQNAYFWKKYVLRLYM